MVLGVGESLRHTPLADSSPLGSRPPWADSPHPPMATASDGTHLTGMHSCHFYSQYVVINFAAFAKNYSQRKTM